MVRHVPFLILSYHSVQDNQKFAHTGNQSYFFSLSDCYQVTVESLVHRVKTCCSICPIGPFCLFLSVLNAGFIYLQVATAVLHVTHSGKQRGKYLGQSDVQWAILVRLTGWPLQARMFSRRYSGSPSAYLATMI